MAPPEFNDIGKCVRDLLTKDYNFGKTKLEAKTVTKSGLLEFTSNLERNDKDGVLKGEIKTKLKHTDTGLTFQDSYSTSNDLGVKVEASELLEGLKLDLDTTFNPPTSKKEAKLGVVFKNPAFVLTGSANVFQQPKIKVDGVIGHEGFVVGAQATFDVTGSKVSDYALALGYSEKDYGATLHANKMLSQFIATYSHNVSKDVTVAAQATMGGSTEKMLFEFGAQYKLDGETTVKGKLETSGKVHLGLIQKVRPDIKATFGVLVDTRKLDDPIHGFGYSLTYEPK